MPSNYSLSGHLDSASAGPLASDLLERRGAPLTIDASEVTFAGTLPLQVLIAAQKQWSEDGQGFQIIELSSGFCSSAEGLGIALSTMGAFVPDDMTAEMKP